MCSTQKEALYNICAQPARAAWSAEELRWADRQREMRHVPLPGASPSVPLATPENDAQQQARMGAPSPQPFSAAPAQTPAQAQAWAAGGGDLLLRDANWARPALPPDWRVEGGQGAVVEGSRGRAVG